MPEPGRVDFYVLAAADATARLRFACRLAEKAYRLGHRVHLHAGSPGQAAALSFRKLSRLNIVSAGLSLSMAPPCMSASRSDPIVMVLISDVERR